jgi:hypothetical protein
MTQIVMSALGVISLAILAWLWARRRARSRLLQRADLLSRALRTAADLKLAARNSEYVGPAEGQVPDAIEPDMITIEADTIEPDTIEPNTIEPDTIEPAEADEQRTTTSAA